MYKNISFIKSDEYNSSLLNKDVFKIAINKLSLFFYCL